MHLHSSHTVTTKPATGKAKVHTFPFDGPIIVHVFNEDDYSVFNGYFGTVIRRKNRITFKIRPEKIESLPDGSMRPVIPEKITVCFFKQNP